MSDKDTLERLVRLETKVAIKFETMDKALVLARELATSERDRTNEALNLRLEGMNEFRRQMDKQEGTYAKKEIMDKEFNEVKRLLYIGLGFVLAIELLLRFLKI